MVSNPPTLSLGNVDTTVLWMTCIGERCDRFVNQYIYATYAILMIARFMTITLCYTYARGSYRASFELKSEQVSVKYGIIYKSIQGVAANNSCILSMASFS